MIGIHGMGRIGRAVLRVALERKIPISAINDRNDLEQIAYLLKYDSVYGTLNNYINTKEGKLIIDNQSIRFIRAMPFPNWADFGVNIVLDCSGGGPDGNKSREHLKCGADTVIISAPANNIDQLLVMGVNEKEFLPEHKIISMASCTTNCVAPIIKAIKQISEIDFLRLNSLNAYTNSQRLVDAPHGDLRLSRAAGLNIIPSESSTKRSIEVLFPELEGRYHAQAFRVPVPCGSITTMSFTFKNDISQDVDKFHKAISGNPFIEFNSSPIVSSDIVGNPASAIIDCPSTKINGREVNLMAFYDNEWGYANRLLDLALYILGRQKCKA